MLAIGSGARAFAGEEDAGRLELVLAYPLRRRDAVLTKSLAVVFEVAVVSVVAFVVLAVLDPLVGLDLSWGRLVEAVGGVAALGVLHGLLALGVGAAVPSRAAAVAVPAAVAAVGYLVNGLHEVASWLDPFRFVSPFWLVGTNPLQNGVRATGMLAVLVVGIAALVAGALLVERRDLKTP